MLRILAYATSFGYTLRHKSAVRRTSVQCVGVQMTRRLAVPRTPFGKRLRFARTEIDLSTQAEAAKRCGLSRATFSRIESGETKTPQADTVAAIAKALHVRGEWLRGDGDIIRPGLYFVYMLTDRNRRVLFVGMCTNLPGQIDRHRRTSDWVRQVSRVDHLAVYGYSEAMAVRDMWVSKFTPVWNVQEAAGQSRTNLVRQRKGKIA